MSYPEPRQELPGSVPEPVLPEIVRPVALVVAASDTRDPRGHREAPNHFTEFQVSIQNVAEKLLGMGAGRDVWERHVEFLIHALQEQIVAAPRPGHQVHIDDPP